MIIIFTAKLIKNVGFAYLLKKLYYCKTYLKKHPPKNILKTHKVSAELRLFNKKNICTN